MKSTKVFLAGMYIHLLLSILTPCAILFQGSWNTMGEALFLFYIIMIAAVHILGWVSAGMAAVAYLRKEYGRLQKGWLLLKFGSVPFYILNFIYSFLAWFILIGASRGLMVFFVPVPVFITCAMIVQSGFFGACYIKYLRKQLPDGERPPAVHYALQMIAVLDIFSTIVLLKKYSAKSSAC